MTVEEVIEALSPYFPDSYISIESTGNSYVNLDGSRDKTQYNHSLYVRDELRIDFPTWESLCAYVKAVQYSHMETIENPSVRYS